MYYSKEVLNKKIIACKKCKKLVRSRKRAVPGYGDFNANIIFLGLAPGRNGADITGVPFTKDPSGKLFQECLIYAGLSHEKIPSVWNPVLKNVYVTNLVKCNPKDEKGNNRYPTKEEIKNCIYYFELERKNIHPKIIVLFGKKVSEIVLNNKFKKFSDVHKNPVKLKNTIYLPFFHPSYVIRGAYNRNKYKQEFKIINDLIEL